MNWTSGWWSIAILASVAVSAVAQEAKVETVVSGLKNPCGVAVQPGSGAVFVSNSGGGTIGRVAGGNLEVVIEGSPTDVYGTGPKYDIGPLGIVFLDKNTLVAGDGGYPDGEEYLRLFVVPESGQAALDYDKDAKTKLGPLAASGDLKAEGNLYGLAATKGAIYVTCNGDDVKGWIASADINGTKFGELKRKIATKEAVNVDAPVAIAISPRGEIVVGQMGEINTASDSLLSFYSAKTHKLILSLETGLHDITGLAYSPKTGLLYATDFAWNSPAEGALYRLDADKSGPAQKIKAVKVAALDKPTALAFDKDGTAYITLIGSPQEGSEQGAGSLVKISGL